jgi:hypothetical protein
MPGINQENPTNTKASTTNNLLVFENADVRVVFSLPFVIPIVHFFEFLESEVEPNSKNQHDDA